MSQSTISKEFALALIKARMTMKAPGKDGKNPHFKSQYMTLDNLTASVLEAMEPHGLMILQQPFTLPGDGDMYVGVETVILHESGQMLSSGRDFYCRVVGGDAQKVGAAVTYLRRYGLGAMLGVIVEEDDDGHGATQRQQVRQDQSKPKLSAVPASVDDDLKKALNFFGVAPNSPEEATLVMDAIGLERPTPINELASDLKPELLTRLRQRASKAKTATA